jgi:ketosteroid isomerase-like protein
MADNVATTAAMFAAWNESNVAHMTEFWTEDGDWVWEDPPDLPDAKKVKGRADVAAHLREMMDVIGGMAVEAEEILDLGDSVLAVVRFRIEGARSGVHLDAPSFHVIRFDGGRVRHYRTFNDRDEALRAAQGTG